MTASIGEQICTPARGDPAVTGYVWSTMDEYEQLVELAQSDHRAIGDELRWLIACEWTRRHPQWQAAQQLAALNPVPATLTEVEVHDG